MTEITDAEDVQKRSDITDTHTYAPSGPNTILQHCIMYSNTDIYNQQTSQMLFILIPSSCLMGHQHQFDF